MLAFDLNDSIISQVRQSADIVEFISLVTPLKQAGKSHKGLCPFHREKTPSFTVDRGKGLFHCFGCGAGGDVFKFLSLSERMTFPEAVEHVANRVGIQLPRKKSRAQDREKESLLAILDDASEAFHQALSWKPNTAEEYLTKRGIAEEIWRKYGFGYAPDSWDYLLTRLGGRHPLESMESAGLALPRKTGNGHYDRFRNRLIIPIHSETGAIIGFGGRSLDGSDPKYLNSPESEVFNKSRTLYNLHRSKDAMRKLDRAILVEGYFDAIALDVLGVPGVVASMGTSLTPGQAAVMGRFARRVVIAYDGDPAGKAATLRATPILLSAGLQVEVLNVGSGEDPDTFIQKYGLDHFMEALGNATDFVTFAQQEWAPQPAMMSSREKTEVLEQFLPLLGAMNGVGRNEAAQRVADGLRLEFDTVWSRIRARKDPSGGGRSAGQPVSTGERQLLRAALQGSLPDSIRIRLKDQFFEDSACRTIYLAIKDDLGAGRPLDFYSIATEVKGEEELRNLSELSLADESEDFSDESLSQILRRMERGFLDRRSREIQFQTQEAEREGDQARVEQLLREKSEIQKQLHSLK